METFREFLVRKGELQSFGKPKIKHFGKHGGDRKQPWKVCNKTSVTVVNPAVSAVTEIPNGPLKKRKDKLTGVLSWITKPRPGMIVPQVKK